MNKKCIYVAPLCATMQPMLQEMIASSINSVEGDASINKGEGDVPEEGRAPLREDDEDFAIEEFAGNDATNGWDGGLW